MTDSQSGDTSPPDRRDGRRARCAFALLARR